ncbi:MAG: thioredoxin [Moraxellaceae bacterium]|uniref:Thioredoxin n=1 Tax=Acinetobacter tjernbergiae DSM 14971 = CIP 107465 TaxID=1120928 RepID=V2UQJ1_9GAMM|nr:thioredoxin [Acinetobacter tjernbergiae]ESK57013.1 thioredoxin C-2 [Acinetobacter tjernbergiae DSM 14971 = CIP 107465]MBH2002886.1 thioredoxin [Moraxellaceae bacterium]MBH2030797.1 thioredoxin [Moraxellaceae bacterium]
MSATIVNTTDENFQADVLDADTAVLVDFWAGWCAPCKAIAPVLEDLSNEYAGKVKIVKVDVTACEDTAVKYNIRNIPALLMFKNGEVVAQQVGAAPRSKLAAFIDQHI